MQSFNAWCLAARPGACLHTKMYARRVDISTTAADMRLTEVSSYYYYYYGNPDLFLEKKFAFLGRQVEKNAFVVSLALFVNAAKRHVRVVAVQYSVDVGANNLPFLGQRVKQLLQPLQT